MITLNYDKNKTYYCPTCKKILIDLGRFESDIIHYCCMFYLWINKNNFQNYYVDNNYFATGNDGIIFYRNKNIDNIYNYFKDFDIVNVEDLINFITKYGENFIFR